MVYDFSGGCVKAKIRIVAVGVIAVAVVVDISPLGSVAWERIGVQTGGVVAVSVSIGIGPLR